MCGLPELNKFDHLRVALVAARLDTSLDAVADAASEQVRIGRYESGGMELSVHASGRALLVLSELYYPGWTATVNGRAAGVWKVDGALRGIVLPRGDSQVSLRFRPARIYVGAALGLTAFGAVLAAPIWWWFRLRRAPGQLPVEGKAD